MPKRTIKVVEADIIRNRHNTKNTKATCSAS